MVGIGDRVIVIEPSSALWGHVGDVVGATATGLMVRMDAGELGAAPVAGVDVAEVVMAFEPFEIDLAELYGK